MSDDQSLNHDDNHAVAAAVNQNEKAAPVAAPSEPAPESTTPAKKRRGFAVMDPKRVSEIASKGGKAAHAAGTAHEFSREEAREAGRKGGYATHARRKAKGTGEGAPSSNG